MCFVFILYFAILLVNVNPQLPKCDAKNNLLVPEGNIGETSTFPWLGVLRVHSHEGDKLKIGLTGLVLIKHRYGIVNANDVAKIPRGHFMRESKAMFILKDEETWSCGVKSILLHPEYEYTTFNTIALVELDFEDNDDLIPICQPDNIYNTSNQLYAAGFVDGKYILVVSTHLSLPLQGYYNGWTRDNALRTIVCCVAGCNVCILVSVKAGLYKNNKILEKVIYKIQYIKNLLCDDFYNRIGFKYEDSMYKPTSYYCGFAFNNKNHCVWDNGMVLASNTTGVWVLIGFGIKGPGCAAPSRFIQIMSYLPWIETATDEIKVF